MKRLPLYLPLLALLAGHPAAAADAARGKQLHDKTCVGCHRNMTGGDGSVLYTRSQRRVHDLAQLESQVRRCETNLNLKWFEDDILDVTEYLNRQYYHFPRKP